MNQTTNMNQTTKKQLPLWGKILLLVLLVVGIFFVRQYLYEIEAEEYRREMNEQKYAKPVSEDNEALLYYHQQVPGREIFLAVEEDVTDDGLKDLVVVYHNPEEGKINWMVGLLNRGDGTYDITLPTRAPIENRAIRFFDMDREGAMEFIIAGEKDGQVGYAIYRVIDGELIDLFGENMEECC